MDITPTWCEIIDDLTWAVEQGERFPSYVDPSVTERAREEIRRIGRHLDQLPAEHRLAPPAPAAHREMLLAVDV